MRVAKVLVVGVMALVGLASVSRAQTVEAFPGLRTSMEAQAQPVEILPPADPVPIPFLTAADDDATPDVARAAREGQADTKEPSAEETASIARPKPEDEDPYAPLGIRAGGFLFLPSVDLSAGYTTNASGIAGGAASGYWLVAPELLFRSDWAQHEATLSMRGSWKNFTDGVTESQPTAAIEATGRIDLPAEWSVDLKAGYDYSRQSVSDPNFPIGVDEAPGVHDLISTAAVNGNLGRIDLTLEGSVGRTIYENGMAGGIVVDQGDRSNTLYGTRVRTAYELTPAFRPFIEGELGWRVYDRPVDDNGIARASTLVAARAGIAYDSGPILKGELAIGVARETFDDPALATLRALTVDGSLAWSPTPLVTVKVDAGTGFNPSDNPLSSGSIAYNAALAVDYAWRRNVTLTWNASLSDERYQGLDLHDRTYSLGFGWVWKLSRVLWLTGDYVHEWLRSSDPASDYESDAVTVGVRWQR
jgi:hypothetical protein